ncbi:hypothetical protein D3C81_2069520 [compost metagenome]
MVSMDTAGVQPVIMYIDQADNTRPQNSIQRISTLPMIFPARNMLSIVPRPRGPMTMPAVRTG